MNRVFVKRVTKERPSTGKSLIRINIFFLITIISVSPLFAHSPYGLWYKWRKDRLFLVTTASDARSYPIGVEIANVLGEVLPKSETIAVRAPTTLDALKLLLSHQFDVALVPMVDLKQAVRGEGEFLEIAPWLNGLVFGKQKPKGEVNPLRVILVLGNCVLISEEHFSDHRAHILAETLTSKQGTLSLMLSDTRMIRLPIPLHEGTISFNDGQSLPRLPQGEKSWLR